MNNEGIQQIADYSDEPRWNEIGWKYTDLAKTTADLHAGIKAYKEALSALDAAGVTIMNAKERMFLLHEDIERLKAQA